MEDQRVKSDNCAGAPFDPVAIRSALDSILASAAFRGSKRCHDFLKYVVDMTLAGDTESLKERTVAVQVFGRKADADLGEDSIVRVGAREVRKRLAQYYVTEGQSDPVRIDLPAGSYVPSFQAHVAELAEPPQRSQAAEAELPAPVNEAGPQPRGWLRPWHVAVLIAAVVVPIGAWRWSHRTPVEFQNFWQPILEDRRTPVVLGLGSPVVYHPTQRVTELDIEKNRKNPIPIQTPLAIPLNTLRGDDFLPVSDQYVGFGDTVASVRLAEFLDRNSITARVRLSSRLDFADLRDASVILIGAFTNHWALEFTQNQRFRFAMVQGQPCVVDGIMHKEYRLTNRSDSGHSADDYMLISRIPKAQTGGFVLIGAGILQYGTQEVGRILSDQDALAPLLRRLPPGWQSKNLEILLHVQIVGDAPAAPELVAFHVW